MARTVELLLLENVEGLGIVGDVVGVRPGYARNFLLPREIATAPDPELIASLADKRREAEAEMQRLRQSREEMIEKLEGHEITLERSCNDLGHLYGSVTQRDIAEKLVEDGYQIKARDVRLAGSIKRVDEYTIHVKLDADLGNGGGGGPTFGPTTPGLPGAFVGAATRA